MKSYLQFLRESKSEKSIDIDIEDIKDMSLDLVDNDIDTKVWNITYHFTVFMEDTQNSKLWGESIHVPAVCIKLKDSQNRFFRWSDISEFVDRLILFLGDAYEIIINWSQDDYNKLEEFLDTDSSEEYYVMEIIIYKKLDY
jgi:hypothetical protein